MSDSFVLPFHFYRDKGKSRCYLGIKKNLSSLDLIFELFSAAKKDFPSLEMSQASFISTKDNDPFVVGVCFEAPGEIPEKYQELKFPIKTL